MGGCVEMECLNIFVASLVKCRWEVWLLAGASVLLKSVVCLASVDWLLLVIYSLSHLICSKILVGISVHNAIRARTPVNFRFVCQEFCCIYRMVTVLVKDLWLVWTFFLMSSLKIWCVLLSASGLCLMV